jgi:hypothetical protein
VSLKLNVSHVAVDWLVPLYGGRHSAQVEDLVQTAGLLQDGGHSCVVLQVKGQDGRGVQMTRNAYNTFSAVHTAEPCTKLSV